MSQPARRLLPMLALPCAIVLGQIVLVAATGPEETQEAPGCPGEQMGVQATGVYQSRPVPAVQINGEPWAGAYWEAGMRSYWHCHAGGQLLVVWEGEGRVQKRGERMRTLHPGESDLALPWEEHWHGAGASTAGQYLQVSVQPTGTYWMEEVSDADYRGNGIGMETRADFLRTGVREQTRR